MLTSIEISTIGIEPWFIPLVATLLSIGLWGFWKSAKSHGKSWTFFAALVSSAIVVCGRWFGVPTILWSGTGALAMVYFCDLWIKKNN